MSDLKTESQDLQQEENALIALRKEKLAAERAKGNAFPNDFRRDSYCNDLQKQYADKTKEELEAAAIPVKVAGRIMLNRGSFMVIQDMTGRIQVYVNRKTLSEETLAAVKTWDLGDIISAEGTLARSGKGDLYVEMTNVRLLTKSLRPLPDKHHGLTDTEQRYRQRYVDLIVNEETRHTFRVRSQVIAHIRSSSSSVTSSKWKRRCCRPSPAAPRPSRSKPTTTRWTWPCSCVSRRSCTSSAWWSVASRRCSRSTATSVTKAFRPVTTLNSPCSSSTRPTPTTRQHGPHRRTVP
jgi:lysyl-tRNA synthetase class 2